VGRVHASVDRSGALGPPWTDGGTEEGGPGHGGALTGAQPPAALVHQSSPAGVQQREERTGSSARASPGLGRRRGDWATAVARRGHEKLGEVWGVPGVIGVAFIGPGEGAGGGWSNGGVNSH
jgi:hypothetical protein